MREWILIKKKKKKKRKREVSNRQILFGILHVLNDHKAVAVNAQKVYYETRFFLALAYYICIMFLLLAFCLIL